jgi:hypothetical protein
MPDPLPSGSDSPPGSEEASLNAVLEKDLKDIIDSTQRAQKKARSLAWIWVIAALFMMSAIGIALWRFEQTQDSIRELATKARDANDKVTQLKDQLARQSTDFGEDLRRYRGELDAATAKLAEANNSLATLKQDIANTGLSRQIAALEKTTKELETFTHQTLSTQLGKLESRSIKFTSFPVTIGTFGIEPKGTNFVAVPNTEPHTFQYPQQEKGKIVAVWTEVTASPQDYSRFSTLTAEALEKEHKVVLHVTAMPPQRDQKEPKGCRISVNIHVVFQGG